MPVKDSHGASGRHVPKLHDLVARGRQETSVATEGQSVLCPRLKLVLVELAEQLAACHVPDPDPPRAPGQIARGCQQPPIRAEGQLMDCVGVTLQCELFFARLCIPDLYRN